MKQTQLKVDKNATVPVNRVHTLVIGSGAAVKDSFSLIQTRAQHDEGIIPAVFLGGEE